MYTAFIMIVYVFVCVLALELHMLMLVSVPVSFLFFLCIIICVVLWFRRPVLMSVMLLWYPFKCCNIYYIVTVSHCLKNEFSLIEYECLYCVILCFYGGNG